MQAVGNGTLAVIMGMNAERRFDLLSNLADNLGQFERQIAAVGVAEHYAVNFGLLRLP